MEKRRNMKDRDNIEIVELTKTINKKKKEDVRKLLSSTTDKTTKRRLGIGKSRMFAIKKVNGEVTQYKLYR